MKKFFGGGEERWGTRSNCWMNQMRSLFCHIPPYTMCTYMSNRIGHGMLYIPLILSYNSKMRGIKSILVVLVSVVCLQLNCWRLMGTDCPNTRSTKFKVVVKNDGRQLNIFSFRFRWAHVIGWQGGGGGKENQNMLFSSSSARLLSAYVFLFRRYNHENIKISMDI